MLCKASILRAYRERNMQLTFLGATGTVTGSKYLINIKNKRYLIDCGLFQGHKSLRLQNWDELPIDPATVDAVFITHAHIDHTGYLPRFVKQGFKGPIYATSGTYDLCSILLPDSGRIQEEDAIRANKYGYTRHTPALPLYTEADALAALTQFKVVAFNEPLQVTPELALTWHYMGHIIGAAYITLESEGKRVLFSGDMGRPEDPVMYPPERINQTDYLIIESTYGDRLHENSDPMFELEAIINKTLKRGGSVLIPAFAVGRTQSMLYYLSRLMNAQRIPKVPVYLDSPMAINATEILCKHDKEHRFSAQEWDEICSGVNYVNTVEASKQLDKDTTPKIILSASGMMTGGRILHHLKQYGPDAKNTILITGYQAGGTRGDRLLRGEKSLKIHGEYIPMNAQLEDLSNLSAHADYEEMIAWLKQFETAPAHTYITHGEPHAAEALKQHIERTLGWVCSVPNYLDEETLD